MKSKFLILLLLIVSFAGADELSDKISKQDSYLKNIRMQIQEQNKQISSAKNEKAAMAARLEKAQLELEYQNKLLRQLNRRYNGIKSEQKALKRKAFKLEKEQKRLTAAIISANKYLVSNNSGEILEALMLSDDTKESEAVSQIVAQVNINLKDSVRRLKENTDKIRKNTEAMETKKLELNSALKSRESAIRQYAEKRTESAQLYSKAAKDEQIKKALLASLQKKEKNIQAQIQRIKKEFEKTAGTSFKGLSREMGKKKGKLIWPVHGHVIDRFGIKKIEGFQGVVQKKGIKIVPTQTTVRCVYDGVVMHSDNAYGLGNFMIVAHPSGFYTLYANMDGISVRKNEKVKTGQTIGTIDIDREENTPYLYFEIRIRNTAVDPLLWLAAS